MAMAMMMATGPASSQSIIRVTYTSDGMHTPTSMMRMMSISTQPPKKPDRPPKKMPMIWGTMAPPRPMIREIRAPTQTRVHRSRPPASVPNQCSTLGGWLVWSRSVVS